MGPTSIHRSVQRRITGTLFVTESLFSTAFIAAITLLSINAAELSGTDALAGLPGTVALLFRATAAVPLGWLMDRAGRRAGIVLGYGFGVSGFPGQRTGIGPLLLLDFVPWLRLDRCGQRGQPTEPLHCGRSLADRTTGARHRFHRLCRHGGGDLRPAFGCTPGGPGRNNWGCPQTPALTWLPQR